MMGTMAWRRAFAKWHGVESDNERKPHCRGETAGSGTWAGGGPCDDWRNVRVGLLRESGEGPLYSRGLRRADQSLHQGGPLTGRMEVGYGSGGKPCGHRSSHAGDDGDLAGDPAG